MNNTTYKKRTGTSGIQGQLYETKLMSLIYFRLILDDNVEKFSLATNRDNIGAFDDIAFKVEIKGFDKPVAVFIQAKHRENDKQLTFTNQTDMAKYFDSYLEIKRAFASTSNDMIFEGKFEETECFFVMYTTAKDDPKNKIYEGAFANCLDELIGTGDCCTQPSYKDEDLDILCKIVIKEQITTLAEQLAKFICEEHNSEMSMNNNDLMLRYHVILGFNVFNVSEIQPAGHRLASFRQDFFATNEEFLMLFKNTLCLEVLKKRNSVKNDSHSLLLKFLSEPSDVTILSKLIGSVLTYTRKKDKLEFVSKSTTDDVKRQLDKANVLQSTVYEAAELAAKEYILSRTLKVPAFFGNKDLAIRGNDKKVEKRLNYLTSKVIDLLNQSKDTTKIITIDESLEVGFLQLNGGVASAVGNILVYDEHSKLLKFTDNCESLGKLGKTWYGKLKSKIENLDEYKLDVKVKNFPKLSFERGEYDLSLVRDFYDRLLFYTNQADQNGIEEILREEIDEHPCGDFNNLRVRSDVIFLKYHDEIQKMWMIPKLGSYLTKQSKIYENAVTCVMSEPLMGVIKIMHNIKNQDYVFNENVITQFGLQGQIVGTIIASESCVLTVAKVEQFYVIKNHVVLDLEYILKLSLKSHNTLCKELTSTIEEKIFIIVCNNFLDLRRSGKRLEKIVKAIAGKQIIVITNKISVDVMTEYFSPARYVWTDERNSFTDLNIESQKKFLATHTIKFQGEDISLNMILDDESVGFIDKDVFYKILNNETVEIGNMGIYKKYNKQCYINRRVSRTKTQEHDKFDDVEHKAFETFYDLEDDVVHINAESGMGKSTLVNHLALKTKQLDPKVWIVRMNFSIHNLMFRKWQIDNNFMNSLESLKFMCLAALRDSKDLIKGTELLIELEQSADGTVSLNKCPGGNTTVFELKMFLHCYNRGKLILLFDDDYELFTLLKFVKSCPRKHKIWITRESLPKTSRKSILYSFLIEQVFGAPYELENFSRIEQNTYLNLTWKYEIQFKNLYTKEMQIVEDFIHFNLERMKLSKSQEKIGKQSLGGYVLYLQFLKMESLAAGIDFSYDEYYNNFKTRFGFCDNTIPCIPDSSTPKDLYFLARDFDINITTANRWIYERYRTQQPPVGVHQFYFK